jgi:hypothetical protein
MGITQLKVSAMMRGDFTNLSERKLMDCLTRLGYEPRGRGFNSCQLHHPIQGLVEKTRPFFFFSLSQ